MARVRIAVLRERRACAAEELEEVCAALERYPTPGHLYRRDELSQHIAYLDVMIERRRRKRSGTG